GIRVDLVTGVQTCALPICSGYTDADVIVHYEVTNVVHLGNTFTMDGYPAIHVDRGGDLDGMIATAESFIRKAAYFSTPMTIVPRSEERRVGKECIALLVPQ